MMWWSTNWLSFSPREAHSSFTSPPTIFPESVRYHYPLVTQVRNLNIIHDASFLYNSCSIIPLVPPILSLSLPLFLPYFPVPLHWLFPLWLRAYPSLSPGTKSSYSITQSRLLCWVSCLWGGGMYRSRVRDKEQNGHVMKELLPLEEKVRWGFRAWESGLRGWN